MNQSIIFNDDLAFNHQHDAWSFSGLINGQVIQVYIHSNQLKQLSTLDQCTKYDLEEVTELWLEKNEPEGTEIHINFE